MRGPWSHGWGRWVGGFQGRQLELDTELQTKLDLSKLDHEKVAALMKLQVLLLDEVSMLDVNAWTAIGTVFSTVDHSKRPDAQPVDAFGSLHVILFGDFKQLPPATSLPPFIVHPAVHENFDFRVLRQNRRIITGNAERAEELQNFHEVLGDVSRGEGSNRVKQFIVSAYVRGAACGRAEQCEFEGSTAIFTKRRYRDKWNRTIVRRCAKVKNHSLKVKGRVRARGSRGQHWFSERRTQVARKKARTQALWHLHLSGDWDPAYETQTPPSRPHLMRCMLVANLALDQRFANGTQGRILYWYPEKVEARKALPASHPELLVRFAKETSLQNKSELLADVDHMDVAVRQETLSTVQGQPVLVQLPIVPSYGLTVHKVQALSIKHTVRGCLEGVFAQGQVYVLISRVTDPLNVELVGLPPQDLLGDVMAAWRAAGFDPIECLRNAASVTGDFEYKPDPTLSFTDRIQAKRKEVKLIPVAWRDLREILVPQKHAAKVIHRLLCWIDRVDEASMTGDPQPAFQREDGGPIFPLEGDEDEKWWLTDVQRKEPEPPPGDDDGPLSSEEEHVSDDGEALVEDEDPSSDEELAADTDKAVRENLDTTQRNPEFMAQAHWPRSEGGGATP